MANPEAKDALRLRNAMRACTCRRCGATGVIVRPGSELNPDTHFAELRYRCCGACGLEEPITRRGRRR